jgi:hypothetical protein
LTPALHDENKTGRFLVTWIAVLEEAELLPTVVSYTGTDMTILPQAPLYPDFAPAFEVDQAVSSYASMV